MGSQGTLRRALCQWSVALAFGAAPSWGAAAHAAGYNGAFWGAQLHLGGLTRVDAGGAGAWGPVVGISGRVATLMSLLDAQLGVSVGGYGGPHGASVGRLSATAELHAHPFFMRHLHNDALSYWLGALHVSLGAGLEVVTVAAPGVDETLPGFGWQIGVGTDIPVGDVDEGAGLWLGVDYRLKFLAVHSAAPGLDDFDEHLLFVTIAWRDNDIGFARVPRPRELDDREPLAP